jgi:hypothetical protein
VTDYIQYYSLDTEYALYASTETCFEMNVEAKDPNLQENALYDYRNRIDGITYLMASRKH